MRWPWQHRDADQDADVDLDAEFRRTRSVMLTTLAELQEQVERAEFREAARERQRRRGINPA
jgi:hypothetical protein